MTTDSSIPRSGRSARAMRLPLVVALAALLVLIAAPSAFASGTPGGITITPKTGSAGTQVQITGLRFDPNTHIPVGFSADSSCPSSFTPLGTASTDSNGTFTPNPTIFTWPSTGTGTAAGVYTICFTDKNGTHASTAQFEVTGGGTNPTPTLTPTPPTGGTTTPTVTPTAGPKAHVSVTSPVPAGGMVLISGTGFLTATPGTSGRSLAPATTTTPTTSATPGQVAISVGPANSNGCNTQVTTLTPNADGSFSVFVRAPQVTTNTHFTIAASSPVGKCASATHYDHVDLLISSGATQPTFGVATPGSGTPVPVLPTFAPSATVTPTPGGGGSGSPTVVIYCLIGLLVLLGILLLGLLFARASNRNRAVTIRERNTPVTDATAQTGPGAVQRDIYAVDPRGRQTPVAQDVFEVEEEPLNDGGR
ncbi:MAG TPA: hypothetical protein VF807_00260 [Ktedonobacterales bacterium]